MDFMNLNQSAHGDREFGFIGSRMRKERKVVVGHWKDPEVSSKIGLWLRVAAAWHESQNIRIARFGDNMREVAVTEGDKVEAQRVFGYEVHGYGLGDLSDVTDENGQYSFTGLPLDDGDGDADILDLIRQILNVADTMVGGPIWRRLIARAESFVSGV